MTVASCPSCKESVTVPVDATPECIVRCPLCHEEFHLREFLNQLPPALIVLDGDTATGVASSGDSTDTDAVDVVTESDVQRLGALAGDSDASSSNVLSAHIDAGSGAVVEDSAPAFDFTPGSVGDEEASAEGTDKVRRRRGKNPVIEALKIIAGALLAVPAAQLLLWMLPGDMKRDLLGIGPAVSRVVPWVVPQQFRAESVRAEGDRGADQPSPRPDISSRRSTTQSARPRATNGSAKPSRPSDPSTSRTGTPQASGTTQEPEPVVKKAASDDSTEPRKQAKGSSQPEDPPAKDNATQDMLINGVRGATPVDTDGLQNAFAQAVAANAAWNDQFDTPEGQPTLLNEQFYNAFARLGEAMTFPPPNDPAIPQLVVSLDKMLGSFATQADKLAMIGNRSAAWLDQTDRPSQGVFLFGTVKKITASAELYETRLELAAIKKRSVTVVSRVDPRGTFNVGDRILMLGAIVEQPDRNLLGYEGGEPIVVMGGFPALLR
jgi:hypothetical protein